MTAAAIALGILAWLIIVFSFLALARAAAVGDLVARRMTWRERGQNRRAARGSSESPASRAETSRRRRSAR